MRLLPDRQRSAIPSTDTGRSSVSGRAPQHSLISASNPVTHWSASPGYRYYRPGPFPPGTALNGLMPTFAATTTTSVLELRHDTDTQTMATRRHSLAVRAWYHSGWAGSGRPHCCVKPAGLHRPACRGDWRPRDHHGSNYAIARTLLLAVSLLATRHDHCAQGSPASSAIGTYRRSLEGGSRISAVPGAYISSGKLRARSQLHMPRDRGTTCRADQVVAGGSPV